MRHVSTYGSLRLAVDATLLATTATTVATGAVRINEESDVEAPSYLRLYRLYISQAIQYPANKSQPSICYLIVAV